MSREGSPRLDALVRRQESLARMVEPEDAFRRIRTIAGADQAFSGKRQERIVSAMVVCSAEDLRPLKTAVSVTDVGFPYIPTFLSFREAPAILDAWKKLGAKPDVLLIDGQGIAHPRGIGLASHVGVSLDVPTIGVAKSRLCGEFRLPGKAGKPEMLFSKDGKQMGWVLLTKPGCRPLFISPGHKVSMGSSLDIVKRCLLGHKLPEPLRLAHNLAGEAKGSAGETDGDD